jgi:L-iditol 2-dehydrogenase
VRISAVGICGSDVHYYETGRAGPNVVRAPHILGHEACGEIVARGQRVQGLAVGTRVALEPGVPCGTCLECAGGRYNLCRNVRFLGAPPVDGALRGHVVIREDLVFPLPDTITDELGALIEPLAVGLWACRRGGVAAGDHVLVMGAGPIGLLSAVAADWLGANVTLVERSEPRRRLAARLGSFEAISPGALSQADGVVRADVLIECSGSLEALAAGLPAVRPGGTVVIVGMAPEGAISLPLVQLQRRELTVVGSFRYAGCFPEAIDLAASGRAGLEAMITSRYPLEETEQALTAAERDPAELKPLVVVD